MPNESLPKNTSKDNQENPWLHFSVRDLPNTSPNHMCKYYLHEIERRGKMGEVAHFIDEKLSTEPKTYNDIGEFCADNPNYSTEIKENLSFDEISAIKRYSGIGYIGINTIARGFWDYNKMGKETPEARADIENTINKIHEAIPKAPKLKEDFLTFRGTNLDGFRSYGVNTLSDLKGLKGQFYLENGFTSTAIDQEKSFTNREDSGLWFGGSDIEVRYHIPAESQDTVALLDDDLSYSPQQTEILINKGSLFYISNVKFGDGSHAVIDMLLLPKDLYDQPRT